MVVIKINDNRKIKRLDIEIERKNITELENLFAKSISNYIDKIIKNTYNSKKRSD